MKRWVVLKFGGTSVSSKNAWDMIGSVIRRRLSDGKRVLVVHSAMSGVTNLLEKLTTLAAQSDSAFENCISEIERKHLDFAAELGLEGQSLIGSYISELKQLGTGISLLGELTVKTNARILSIGELLSTTLGAAYLNKTGILTTWIDARKFLHSEPVKSSGENALYLSAQCFFDPDEILAESFAQKEGILLTQGFIAGNRKGETVILGRGGSDTSASYFGAKLGAERVEIWTDVPGMFSANPQQITEARLLRQLDYDEAQEIASTGSKVLHPRCVAPVKALGIPMWVMCTHRPELPGTVISDFPGDGAEVKAISVKKGIVLISMETVSMWHQAGFLADAFELFKRRSLSIDLVSTSETAVTVTLDPAANTLDNDTLESIRSDLSAICKVSIKLSCAAVSVVGRRIRAILPKLGEALELFEERNIYLVSQAASDLNISFVVDGEQCDRLAAQLHQILIADDGETLGPTWGELMNGSDGPHSSEEPWWKKKRNELLTIGAKHTPVWVYDSDTLESSVKELSEISALDRILYAVKANFNNGILRIFEQCNLMFEAVSRGEIEHLLASLPGIDPKRILFTPNFAPKDEYEFAFSKGIPVTLDNLYPLVHWPDILTGRELFVRIDLGIGKGHHKKVKTAGRESKFGIPADEISELKKLAETVGARITGLHTHVGSGIFEEETWKDNALLLSQIAGEFDTVSVLDLGGGFGIPEKTGQKPVNIAKFAESLERVKSLLPQYKLWVEPGRYLTARSGVLLVTVTQTKGKGDSMYVGVDTGMNSLIRPALYGSHHDIVNLTRLGEASSMRATVVGPICESGDILGVDRRLPESAEGDILLIANAGAYGRAMSSHYNLREPGEEVLM